MMLKPAGWMAAVSIATMALLGACDTSSKSNEDEFYIGGNVEGLEQGKTFHIQLHKLQEIPAPSSGAGLKSDPIPIKALSELAIGNNGTFKFPVTLKDLDKYSCAVSQHPAGQSCGIQNGTGQVSGSHVTNVNLVCLGAKYSVGVTVSSLTSTVVLQNNGSDDLTIGDNNFNTFATKLSNGSGYNVTVKTQPMSPPQLCTVVNGSGTISGSNVTSVAVNCADVYTIGGTVSGLAAGAVVNLTNTATGYTDGLSVNAAGQFTFSHMLLSGDTYNVTVSKQPQNPWQYCTVTNGTGTVAASNVTNVQIECVNVYGIGGTLSGLSNDTVTLQNNGGDTYQLASNGTFSFPTKLASGSAYSAAVSVQPVHPSEICTVSNGQGVVQNSNVNNIAVNCTISKFTIGGLIGGYAGSGLVLQNNAGDDLAITQTGSSVPFTFATALPDLSTYTVTVKTQPTNPSQTCTVTNGSGTLGGTNITNISILCVTNTFPIGGVVGGLLGYGLVLQNNGGDDLSLNTIGGAAENFQFATPIPDQTKYNVTVKTQPTNLSQTCAPAGASGTGTVDGGTVKSVSINCTTNTFNIKANVTGLAAGASVLLGCNGYHYNATANGTFTINQLLDGTGYSTSVITQPSNPYQTCTVGGNASGTLAGQDVTVPVTCVTNKYYVGGTVTGLAGNGLTLNNGGDSLPMTKQTPPAPITFKFPTQVNSGASYNVTATGTVTQLSQACKVASGGTGTVVNSDIQNVNVQCTTNTFTVGGQVVGLLGSGLVLQNNGGGDLPVAKGSSTFTFSAPMADGSTYAVTVKTGPTGPTQACSVSDGTGTLSGQNVTGVQIHCSTESYSLGGTLSGLSGDTVELKNTKSGQTTSLSGNGAFTFPGKISDGTPYSVIVLQNPQSPLQICTVTNGSGTFSGADVTNVAVSCAPGFTVSANVYGMYGSGMVLQNNDGGTVMVAGNGQATFPDPVGAGGHYSVTVKQPPSGPSQTCWVSNASGTVHDAGVTSPNVVCKQPLLHYLFVAGGGLNQPGNLSVFNADDITGVLTPVGNTYQLDKDPLSVAVDPTGKYVYIAVEHGNTDQGGIHGFYINGSNGALTPMYDGGAFPTNNNQPVSVVVDGQGQQLYALSNGANSLVSFTISSNTNSPGYLIPSPTPLPVPALGFPNSVNIDPLGRFLYFANSSGVQGYQINNPGQLDPDAGLGPYSASNPSAITIDYKSRFVFAATGSNNQIVVFSINPSKPFNLTNVGTFKGNEGSNPNLMNNPVAIAVHPSADFLYVANNGGGNVSVFSFDSSGKLTQLPQSPVAAGNKPVSITLDWSGRFAYVVNQTDQTVSMYSVAQGTGMLSPLDAGLPSTGSYPTSAAYATPGIVYLMGVPSNPVDNVRFYSVVPTTGYINPLQETQNYFNTTNAPSNVAVDPTGTYLYATTYAPSGGVAYIYGYTFTANDDPNQMTFTSIPGSPFPSHDNYDLFNFQIHPSGTFGYAGKCDRPPGAVDQFNLDPSSGALSVQNLDGGMTDSGILLQMAMDPPGNNLYAMYNVADSPPCTTCPTGHVSWFTINSQTGALTHMNDYPIEVQPTQVAVDSQGKYLYVSNKFGNPRGSYPYLDIFAITPQGSPNAGSLTPVSGSPFAIGNGQMTEMAYNMAVHPYWPFFYILDQRSGGCVYSFSYSQTGGLSQTGSACPPSSGATPYLITPDPTGRYLIVHYKDSTGNAWISTMFINGMTGQLTNVPTYPCIGSCTNTPKQIVQPLSNMSTFFAPRGQ
jgi:6-phosphogluconolactonase (cycloisomerase 2 family)